MPAGLSQPVAPCSAVSGRPKALTGSGGSSLPSRIPAGWVGMVVSQPFCGWDTVRAPSGLPPHVGWGFARHASEGGRRGPRPGFPGGWSLPPGAVRLEATPTALQFVQGCVVCRSRLRVVHHIVVLRSTGGAPLGRWNGALSPPQGLLGCVWTVALRGRRCLRDLPTTRPGPCGGSLPGGWGGAPLFRTVPPSLQRSAAAFGRRPRPDSCR